MSYRKRIAEPLVRGSTIQGSACLFRRFPEASCSSWRRSRSTSRYSEFLVDTVCSITRRTQSMMMMMGRRRRTYSRVGAAVLPRALRRRAPPRPSYSTIDQNHTVINASVVPRHSHTSNSVPPSVRPSSTHLFRAKILSLHCSTCSSFSSSACTSSSRGAISRTARRSDDQTKKV